MRASLQQTLRNMLRLGTGETVARLCGIATTLFLAHRYGVIVVGAYALAQSMSQYSLPFIDFGLKHVGARLVAQYPDSAEETVRRIQKRRLLMAGILLPFLLIYAVATKLPSDVKAFLFVFSAVSSLYAFSLDWAAWGKEHLRLVGLAKAIVSASILAGLVIGRNSGRVLWWLALGNAAGYGLLAATFWVWWRKHKPADDNFVAQPAIQQSLEWRRSSIMGLALLCNLAFATIDMLMLGLMSDAQQVGLYSAAYRVVGQVLFTYYMVTQALFPRLARQDVAQRLRMLRPQILLFLAAAGIAIAALLAVWRQPVLTVLFGRQFLPASVLLLLLAWAIPMDFVTSYLSNAYIAWGMEKKVLLCTVIAAGSNVVLNLIWIPAYGAKAAAVNTLISYVIFLTCLALTGRYAEELTSQLQPQAELIT